MSMMKEKACVNSSKVLTCSPVLEYVQIMSTRFAIVNQKGGVGKTTTAVNLATAFAAIGKRVLVLDLDPQGNASTGLGVSAEDRALNIYQVLVGHAIIKDVIRKTIVPGLFVAPSDINLAAIDVEIASWPGRQRILKEAIEEIESEWDIILMDCPPSLGLLTINALVCASEVIVPMQSEFFALEGLAHLVRTIDLIKKNLNPGLEIGGIIMTMLDKRSRLSNAVEKEVRDMFGERVMQTVIPRNVKLSEAPSHGKPALIYDSRCAGSIAYIMLAKEMCEKMQGRVVENEG